MMPDREKVIKALENCVRVGVCINCEYDEHIACKTCLMADALSLLKEQETVEPRISEAYRTQSGRMSRRRAFCGACGLRIRIGSNKQDRSNFCERCGKAVKWE